MPKFMIAYHGGSQPNSKEEGAAHMKRWKEWITELGDQVINPGTPLMSSKLITANNIVDDINKESMKGFAIITADDFDKACEIAKSDPFLKMSGTIRISQMMEKG